MSELITPDAARVTADSVPRPSARIASRVVDGKALVVVIDRRKLHSLNEVGSRVLELCDGKRDANAIAQALTQELDVGIDQALSDVVGVLGQLLDEGAIELVSGGEP
jgi:hypothetical protein